MLTQSQVHALFSLDKTTGILYWKVDKARAHIGDIAGSINSKGYWYVQYRNKNYRRSRLIFLYVHGYLPKEVDHENRIRNDDRPSNLRAATTSQQMHNRRGWSKQFLPKGVHTQRSGRFQAQIRENGKIYSLGTFNTAEEAGDAYIAASKERFGDFAFSSRNLHS